MRMWRPLGPGRVRKQGSCSCYQPVTKQQRRGPCNPSGGGRCGSGASGARCFPQSRPTHHEGRAPAKERRGGGDLISVMCSLSLRAFSYFSRSAWAFQLLLAASHTYLKLLGLTGSCQYASHVTDLSCRTCRVPAPHGPPTADVTKNDTAVPSPCVARQLGTAHLARILPEHDYRLLPCLDA